MQAALACPASDFIVAAVAVLTTTGFCICISLAGHRRVHGAIFLVLLVCSQVYTSSCTIHKLASLQAFTFLELNWVALLVAYSLYRRHIGQGLRLGSYSILHTTSRRAYSTCTSGLRRREGGLGTVGGSCAPRFYLQCVVSAMSLPEIWSVGITCQLVDLLPSLAAIGLLLAFIWQAALGFR